MSSVSISDKQIRAFSEDGVVCLRGAFDAGWIARLRSGVERNISAPSERGRIWDLDAEGRTCFYDSQVWRGIEEYRAFVFESSMAEIAGRLMQSDRVNFFFDAVFVRSPGNGFRTPFHQDEPYWSVEGFDTCSAWMPLVPVEKKSALEFVRGSHRWQQKFRQTNFGALTGDARDQVVFGDDAMPFPDIEGDRERYEILSWDMEPGDVVVFNARLIHGGSGNLSPERDLMVFNTQWLGDDVRVKFRPEGMDPDHSAVMTAAGLRPGDRIGTDLYPEVWLRESRESS
jgi:ectoine hydroxylase-related dioxygenase (phytanoyl-CoA dioxygenase family)